MRRKSLGWSWAHIQSFSKLIPEDINVQTFSFAWTENIILEISQIFQKT
jgi:hypothetical protein